jgi:hypothetical protein
MCISIIKKLFDDKRFTLLLLLWWLCTTIAIFYYLGAFHIHFMTVGPSEETEFMGMKINTWTKWHCLAQFSFWNTAINEFLGSALIPWFQNTIQDHKCKFLPYSKEWCMSISLAYDAYTHVMGVFGIFLFFSQIDFLAIRMAADILVTYFTTITWMQNKTVHSDMYETQFSEMHEVHTADNEEMGLLEKDSIVVDASKV